MALSKKTVGIIVGLMVIAVAGLVLLQIDLLKSSMTLKEQTFRRNVSNALIAVSDAIETREATITALEVAQDSAQQKHISAVTRILENDSTAEKSAYADSSIIPGRIRNIDIASCIIADSLCKIDTVKMEDLDLMESRLLNLGNDSLGGPKYIMRLGMSSDSGSIEFVQRVIDRLWSENPEPIQNRIELPVLDSILELNLRQAGIELDYAYAIKTGDSDSLWPPDNEYESELLVTDFGTRMFPHDIFAPQYELRLYFPDADFYIWRQIGPMLLLTIIFIIIIIFSFIYTIRTILAQKRNATLMVEFVNNMTHEFKTPISTVALAGEAIVRPDVIENKEKVTRFSKMILDENSRMRRQTDKILQMATLEEGDFELKLTDVDIHEIINKAINGLILQIEEKGGKISHSLETRNPIITADRDHISNIIFNLLDNAIKYSPKNPLIMISTKDAGGGIEINIDDNGIGIAAEDLKMIFEKYYRVSTGNIHDVKGFGLGLSYVKLMVEAHGGKITIKSTPGEGTGVCVFLPYSNGRY